MRSPQGSRRPRIGEMLLAKGLLSQADLDLALDMQKGAPQLIGAILVDLEMVSRADLYSTLSEQMGVPYVDLLSQPPDPALVVRVPRENLRRYHAVPHSRGDRLIRVAMAEPIDVIAMDDIRMRMQETVEPLLADDDLILAAIDASFDFMEALRRAYVGIAAIPDTAAGPGIPPAPATEAAPLAGIQEAIADVSGTPAQVQARRSPWRPPRGDGRTILVVDDERTITGLVETNLLRAGYKAVVAYDGVEALEKLRDNPVDAVVLDIMMPRMDGGEVLSHMRADGDSTPVVMLTAKSQSWDIARGYERGADRYLTKPFNPCGLLEVLYRVFNPPPPRPERPVVLVVSHRRGVAQALDTFAIEVLRDVEFRHAGDADEPLAILRSCRVDLVLVDLGGPGGQGARFIRELRQAGHSLPVVVISDEVTREDAETALAAGAQGLLRDPFDHREAGAVIDQYTSGLQSESPATASPDDLLWELPEPLPAPVAAPAPGLAPVTVIQAPPVAPAATPLEQWEPPEDGRPIVLIVDSERPISRLLQMTLEREGHHALCAYSGAEALGKLCTYDIDVVTLELALPDMDGMQILRDMRARGDTRMVLVLTARAQDCDILAGWEAGADCYLTKPFRPEEIVAFVRNLLKQRDTEPGRARFLIAHPDCAVTRDFRAAVRPWGYPVSCVDNGDEVLDVAPDGNANILVLSDDLPATDGLDVTETLRAMGHQQPILLLSSDASPEALGVAYGVGVDVCLEMPASVDDMRSAARYYAQLLAARPELFGPVVDEDFEI
ncbi:MAG: response regulator [Armatimonadetes bacterium]|nr:response regulator [Armatimonadota bacterium]